MGRLMLGVAQTETKRANSIKRAALCRCFKIVGGSCIMRWTSARGAQTTSGGHEAGDPIFLLLVTINEWNTRKPQKAQKESHDSEESGCYCQHPLVRTLEGAGCDLGRGWPDASHSLYQNANHEIHKRGVKNAADARAFVMVLLAPSTFLSITQQNHITDQEPNAFGCLFAQRCSNRRFCTPLQILLPCTTP